MPIQDPSRDPCRADRPAGNRREALIAAAAVLAASVTPGLGGDAPAATPATAPAPQPGGTMRPSGNTILITGGGSGIGRELALRFNDLGNTVIVAGRRQKALEETIAGRKAMHAMELDVEDAGAIAAFAGRVAAAHPDLNVLINNAGIMRVGEDLSKSRDLREAESQIATNLLGPIRLTNALIDHLKTRPNPAIVNVSSGLAFVPRADAATYSATKTAIHFYTVALREQLKGVVKVVELVPPAVRTDLTPGQATRESAMPLADFIDEVMRLFAQQPTPDEILVQRVGLQRYAEREGRFDQTFDQINARARASRR